MQIVWFKRDLRVADHPVLAQAARAGPVLALYVLEPSLWRLPEASGRQFAFLLETLASLDGALRRLGGGLVIRVGEAVEVFARLQREAPIDAIWSSEETGLLATYARDRALARWAKSAGIAWREAPQSGVVRRLPTRNGWARRWDRFMTARIVSPPEDASWIVAASDPLPSPADLGLQDDPCPQRQLGGREAALDLMEGFLILRGRRYRREMSSPLTAFEACSRLSPHFALGAVSIREAVHAAARAEAAWRLEKDDAFVQSIASFRARLAWRDHFMQKLEDAPDLERRALHPAYEGLRPQVSDDDPRLRAWIEGRTGFPFLDACMRALDATGWLNFRMRAMTMAFASYHLWLDWRAPAGLLAARFTDFEPGIHYAQAQMQSGVTGVNTARIYNPVKQSVDQDPDGVFIRRWLPELAALPTALLHEPWRAPDRLPPSYPARIVNHEAAAAAARERIYAVRRGAEYRAEASAIQEKHGSRKSGIRARGQRPKRTAQKPQPDLFGDPNDA